MITSMRRCVACDDLWPWPISSRSFDLDFENRVRSVMFSVLDRLFFWLGIQYDPIVWVIMRRRGVSSERRRSSCSSCFWSVSAAAVLPTLFNFPGKPLKLISSNYTWLTYGCGKIFCHPSWTKLPKRDAIYLVPAIKWEPATQPLQNLVDVFPLSFFPPD